MKVEESMKLLHFLSRLFGSHTAPPPISMAGSNTGLENAKQIHNFLIEEYKYANEYAQNTLRDRTLTYNLSALTFGAISVALIQILIAQHNASATPVSASATPAIDFYLIIASLLTLFGFVNLFYFAHFVTLEKNYQDSLSRMKKIREYYMQFISNSNTILDNVSLNEIFSVEGKEDCQFMWAKNPRPTNRAACTFFTIFELASFVLACCVFFGLFLKLDLLLVFLFAVVGALILAFWHARWYQIKPFR